MCSICCTNILHNNACFYCQDFLNFQKNCKDCFIHCNNLRLIGLMNPEKLFLKLPQQPHLSNSLSVKPKLKEVSTWIKNLTSDCDCSFKHQKVSSFHTIHNIYLKLQNFKTPNYPFHSFALSGTKDKPAGSVKDLPQTTHQNLTIFKPHKNKKRKTKTCFFLLQVKQPLMSSIETQSSQLQCLPSIPPFHSLWCFLLRQW